MYLISFSTFMCVSFSLVVWSFAVGRLGAHSSPTHRRHAGLRAIRGSRRENYRAFDRKTCLACIICTKKKAYGISWRQAGDLKCPIFPRSAWPHPAVSRKSLLCHFHSDYVTPPLLLLLLPLIDIASRPRTEHTQPSSRSLGFDWGSA